MEAQVAYMEGENRKLNKTIEQLQMEKLKLSGTAIKRSSSPLEFKYGAINFQKMQDKVDELKKKNAFLV